MDLVVLANLLIWSLNEYIICLCNGKLRLEGIVSLNSYIKRTKFPTFKNLDFIKTKPVFHSLTVPSSFASFCLSCHFFVHFSPDFQYIKRLFSALFFLNSSYELM
jgi:hypothetical protein